MSVTVEQPAGLPVVHGAAPMPVRLERLSAPALPDWADAFLAPADGGDLFATRLWYDATLARGLPSGGRAELAVIGHRAGMVALLRGPGGLRALTTPYTLEWRPLLARGDAAASREAGRSFGAWRRGRAPLRLEAMDPEAPGLRPFWEGVAEAGIAVLPYRHFGNWHEELPVGASWEDYLLARPPELRSTIQRKLRRAARDFSFELLEAPGAPLEAGIAAYETVRAASWKPAEPSPDFDAALMRAAAAQGALRLGVLRDRDGGAVAAQYWLVSGARAWLLKLCHAEAARGASPGTALTALMIQGLLARGGLRELDFGRGDDAYKRLWVARRRQRVGVVLAHAWHPAGLAAVARHRLSVWLGRGA